MNRPAAVYIGLAFYSASIAQAGTGRHDVDSALFEDAAALPVFNSVGRLNGTNTDGGGYLCSGTLIGCDWVLTAGHCVDSAASIEFEVGGQSVRGDAWGHHPYWLPHNPLNVLIGFDAGLVHLETPVTDVLPASRFRGTNELGRDAAIVGFGQTGTGLSGALPNSAGGKRAGSNRIDAYFLGDRNTSRVFLTDFDHPDDPGESLIGSAAPTELEFQTAPGDSGGGVFVLQAGEVQLAGINSFLGGFDFDFVNADYGDVAGATRVAAVNSWIDAVLQNPLLLQVWGARADLDSGLLQYSWEDVEGWSVDAISIPIPEPSSRRLMCMLLALLGVMAARTNFSPQTRHAGDARHGLP